LLRKREGGHHCEREDRSDGTDYFDLHHTPDDTLDKIDPNALAQNVAAYTVMACLAAESDGSFGSEAKDVVPPRE